MIVFDLKCENAHVFEVWFGSSQSYEDQKARNLVACPICQSSSVEKAVMAPAVGAKGNRSTGKSLATVKSEPVETTGKSVATSGNPEDAAKIKALMGALATAQAKALEKSDWVGKDFAKRARAMHYGEENHRPIHGQSDAEEAQSLADEGVNIAPLPFPVLPPEAKN